MLGRIGHVALRLEKVHAPVAMRLMTLNVGFEYLSCCS